jgi:hypothetical protein
MGIQNMDRNVSTLEWLQHLQEELMDANVYIEKLKNEMKETRVVMGVCFGERKDFDYSAIQYHGKTKNYKKQQPEEDDD